MPRRLWSFSLCPMHWLIFITTDSLICVTVQQKILSATINKLPFAILISCLSELYRKQPRCLSEKPHISQNGTSHFLLPIFMILSTYSIDLIYVLCISVLALKYLSVPCCCINSQATKLWKMGMNSLPNLKCAEIKWNVSKQALKKFCKNILNTSFSPWPSSISW